jgi:site-specific DNA-cytosine methylase
MVDGVFRRMDEDRSESLGNSIVPDVAEWIGRRIVERMSAVE